MKHVQPPTIRSSLLMLCATLWLSACHQLTPASAEAENSAIETRLDELSAQVASSQRALDTLEARDTESRTALNNQLHGLSEQLAALPETLELSCPETPSDAAGSCEDVTRVVVTDDKMLVGELEYVWIDPPGVSAVARVDTGATSSSLNAVEIMSFERDGDDWVRFDMLLSDGETVTVERQIIRYARVIQQADPDGSRRPVVEMRVRLGDVEDTFEFTLADRSHLENGVILGRNFLADVTLVDVGQQFIQPRYTPPQ
ncbi:MAG: RimK/LysX family protein [Pseudomonadota bacterium]